MNTLPSSHKQCHFNLTKSSLYFRQYIPICSRITVENKWFLVYGTACSIRECCIQGCMKEMKDCKWRQDWTDLARSFAFQYNPALQPRAIIVFGCISKMVSDSEVKQLLRILVKALESYTDLTLIEAIIICLTRLQPLLRQVYTLTLNIFPLFLH